MRPRRTLFVMKGATALSVLAMAVCAAAALAPVASAKGLIAVTLGNAKPQVGQSFPVYVQTGYVVPED